MTLLRFTEDHEWVRLDGDIATVGITDHAQEALGDLVFVDLPEPGRAIEKAETVAVVESVKAASDVYAPLSGEVTEANAAIVDDPALVNRDPAGEGWFFRMKVSDPSAVEAMMDEAAYATFVDTH